MATPNYTNTTIEYFDGFDDYSTSQINRYWTTGIQSGNPYVAIAFPGNITISSGTGRNSTFSCHFNGSQTSLYLTCPAGYVATRTVGVAMKATTFTDTVNNNPRLIIFHDGVTPQVGLLINPTGTLSVYRFATNGTLGTLLLGPTTLVLSLNTYYYIEMSATVNSSTGAATVRVNGAVVLSGTGLNTANTTNNASNGVSVGCLPCAGSVVMDIDDVYVRADGTFCGDSRVESRLPTGNGATIQMTIGGSTLNPSNYQQVYDNPSDDDTTYVYAATAGLEDEYSYAAIPTASGTVYAVMAVPVCRGDSAGTVTVEPVYRSGGTDYFGVSVNVSATSYNAYPDIQGFDPNTGTNWTIAGVNAAQFGLKRTV